MISLGGKHSWSTMNTAGSRHLVKQKRQRMWSHILKVADIMTVEAIQSVGNVLQYSLNKCNAAQSIIPSAMIVQDNSEWTEQHLVRSTNTGRKAVCEALRLSCWNCGERQCRSSRLMLFHSLCNGFHFTSLPSRMIFQPRSWEWVSEEWRMITLQQENGLQCWREGPEIGFAHKEGSHQAAQIHLWPQTFTKNFIFDPNLFHFFYFYFFNLNIAIVIIVQWLLVSLWWSLWLVLSQSFWIIVYFNPGCHCHCSLNNCCCTNSIG